MTAVGFEPTQLSLVELESTPLDHSGKLSWRYALSLSFPPLSPSLLFSLSFFSPLSATKAVHGPSSLRTRGRKQCSLWGSNPRPMAHKTIALTTELRELVFLQLPSASSVCLPLLLAPHSLHHMFKHVSCGARTHAELPPVDLKSTPLTTRAN